MSEQLCVGCGVEFLPRRKKQKYCSNKCCVKHHSTTIQRLRYERDAEYRKKMVALSAERRRRFPTEAKEYRTSLEERSPGHLDALRRQWYDENRKYAQTTSLMKRMKELASYPWRPLLRSAKSRAKRKGIPFDLTDAWAQKRWTGYCEITHLPMSLAVREHGGSFSPSIDRIDSKKGYTQDNCRFILYAVNIFKREDDDETMFIIAEAIIACRTN